MPSLSVAKTATFIAAGICAVPAGAAAQTSPPPVNPAPVSAPSEAAGGFGSRGQIIARGAVSAGYSSQTSRDMTDAVSSEISETSLSFGPEVGVLVVDSLEVGGALTLGTTSLETTTPNNPNPLTRGSRSLGLLAQAIYHFVRSSSLALFAGAGLGYASEKTSFEILDTNMENTHSGLLVRLNGGVELIFGGRGILGLGAVLTHFRPSVEVDGMDAGSSSVTSWSLLSSLGIVVN